MKLFNDIELKNINEFVKEHGNCHKSKLASKFKIKAIATGLGFALKIKCCNCGTIKDVSDYDNW